MGLKKFTGDDRAPTQAEIDTMLGAVEFCNKDRQSVALVICLDRQLHMVHDSLQKIGYKKTQTMGFHKQFKSDKRPQGGFISSLLFAVVGWKNVQVLQHASFPSKEAGASSVDRLKYAQNCWDLYKPAKKTLDVNYAPVNLCPQDPIIPEKFIQMFHAIFGKDLVVFSSGESSGWVAPVALRMGFNCVCTEPDSTSFHYLEYNLLASEGTHLLEKGKQEHFWRRVRSFHNARIEEEELEDESGSKVDEGESGC